MYSRINLDIENGVVLIGSDLHCWPGPPPVAFRAFTKFCRDLEPKLVVLNGDVIDGTTVSRHPPIGWSHQPSVVDELLAAQECLEAIKCERTIWNVGNHDIRFDTRLRELAPQYEGIHGVRLKDHFPPSWQSAMSVWINNDIIIKHRYKGGADASLSGSISSGKTIVTGHLHSLRVSPYTDYTGTRWGIDSGMLADPWGPQFAYLEDNPRNWRAGFVVLTIENSTLLWPELVFARDQTTVEFRGRVVVV